MKLGWYARAVEANYRWRLARRTRLATIFAERGWQRPYEGVLMVVCLLGALLSLILNSPTSVIVRLAFGDYTVWWYVGCAFGAAVTLAGLSQHSVTGLLVERIGLLAISGWLMSFAVVGIAAVGRDAITVCSLVGATALGNLHRCFQISVDLRELEDLVARAALLDDEEGG